jgi:hypothetical protein
MRWYYLNQFTRYQKALEKLKLHILDKNDVLGHEDTSRRTTVLSGSKITGAPHDAFNLGRRIDVLKTTNQLAISSYLAEEDQSTHYLEVPFRHFNIALIDNATAEYTFLATFFSPSLSFAAISRHFNSIFDPAFALGQALTRQLVAETYDGLGVLLCVRLNQHSAFELPRARRRRLHQRHLHDPVAPPAGHHGCPLRLSPCADGGSADARTLGRDRQDGVCRAPCCYAAVWPVAAWGAGAERGCRWG